MSLIIGDKVIVGPGNSPYVGNNGHWFVGTEDTGVPAETKIFYKSLEEFNTCYDEGIYHVYDADKQELHTWHINNTGKKSPITSSTVLVPRCGENGNWFLGEIDLGIPFKDNDSNPVGLPLINDNVIADNNLWSSFKVNQVVNQVRNDGIPGKALEFNWRGNELGVRQEGQTEYQYQNLIGNTGLTGLDGSSIFDARIDENGNLILTVQDVDDDNTTHQVFDVNNVFTKEDWKSIQNAINRLNREVYNIKKSQIRKLVPVNHSTDGEYERVYTLNGTGNIQILTSPFAGTVRIIVDGSLYSFTNKNIDDMSSSSLLSLTSDNKLVATGLFDNLSVARGLDIQFDTSIIIEIMLDNSDVFPKFLLQGTCYCPTTDDQDPESGGDFIPVTNMSTLDVDLMMGLV